MDRKLARSRMGFLLTLAGVLALSPVLTLIAGLREAGAILLMAPLIWAYMIFRPRDMAAVAVVVATARVMVEILNLVRTSEPVTPLAVARESLFPLILYLGLAFPFYYYRKRQAALVMQLVAAGSKEARDRLASSLTHDFNNILSIICGTSELLLKDKTLNVQAAQDIHTILSAGQQGTLLVQQMRRQVSVPAPGPGPENLVLCDLSDVVGRQMDMIARMLAPQVRIAREFSDVPLPVRLDVGQVFRVLINLSLNARDAMKAGGVLTVRTATSFHEGSAWAELNVGDTGPGIDPTIMDRLFEPFVTTRADQGGVGLGLSIVQALVKTQGGSIRVQSQPGKGATFTILLPLAKAPDVGKLTA